MYISNMSIFFCSQFNDKDLTTFLGQLINPRATNKTEYVIPMSLIDRIYKCKGALNIDNSIGIRFRSEETDEEQRRMQ